jgi:hypothetical protein
MTLVASRKFNDSGTVYEAGEVVNVSPERAEYLLRRNFIHDPSKPPEPAPEPESDGGKKGKK